jgi:hypothetical protein
MRVTRTAFVLAMTTWLACRSPKTVPEPGAILVHVQVEADAPVPDELRAWVYDDTGALWSDTRIPAEGTLNATNARDLGSILIQPGPAQGGLRLHLRGLLQGVRTSDGTLSVAAGSEEGDRTFDVLLGTAIPVDADHDDVPDAIDDCPSASNPLQGGCPVPEPTGTAQDDAGTSSSDGPEDAGAYDDAYASIPDDATVDTDLSSTRTADAAAGPDLASTNGDAPLGSEARNDAREAGDAGNDRATAVDAPKDQGLPGSDGPRDTGPATTPDVQRMDAPARDLGMADADASLVDLADAGTAPPSCPDGGTCDKTQGMLCAGDNECASGFCADGVCCTNACVGPCRSCNQPSTTGVCQGYTSGTDPEAECGAGNTCNGVGACGPGPAPDLPNGQLCAAGSQCKSGFCIDGVCCESACADPCQTCGTGACLAVKKADDVPECSGTMTCNPRGMCVAR